MTREEAMFNLEMMKMAIRFNDLYGEGDEMMDKFFEAIDIALADMTSMDNLSHMVIKFPKGDKE